MIEVDGAFLIDQKEKLRALESGLSSPCFLLHKRDTRIGRHEPGSLYIGSSAA